MKNKALNAFYENLLKDVGVVDGGDGKLSYHRLGVDDSIAITIDGKRLTLPTRENLKLGTQQNIMFHPASEQLMSGPSPILDAFREYIMLRISTTASSIAQAAMTVALSVPLQKKIKGKANDLVLNLVDADPKMETALGNVLDNIGMTPETRMYNIFLVASGSKENPRGLRTAKVSFPILDDAHSDDLTEFFKVKNLRKTKDKAAIVNLLCNIFNVDADDKNPIVEYTSVLHQAPYFHSLLTAFYAIGTHQNLLIEGLSKAVPSLKELAYELDWTEEFEDFENFVKKVGYAVPLLPGNKGKAMTEEAEEEIAETRAAKSSSWKQLRDDIDEEPEVDKRDIRILETSQRETGRGTSWRDLLNSDKKDGDRNSGVRFGERDRGRKRGGFDSLADRDDRDDRRGSSSYRDRQYPSRDTSRRGGGSNNGGWRDRFR